MIKRLITLLIVSFFVCSAILANEEYNIALKKGDSNSQTIELPYGVISLQLVEYGNYHKVVFSIENTTTSQAILLFRNAQDEKSLKKNKPKIVFEKTYPGSKGKRTVYGCKEYNKPIISIIPQDKLDILGIPASTKSITKLELPIYLAKYDPKKLVKKGPYNVNYKVLSEDIITFNIEIKGWTENDPVYVATKAAVEEYIQSADTVSFCNNTKHTPSLKERQKPYIEKKDSLINVIESTIQNHSDWFSTDLPHIKYTELLAKLKEVKLDKHLHDCGKHEIIPGKETPPRHIDYSIIAQKIYHQLVDIYQQLRAGKLTKAVAVKKANRLNNSYQKIGKVPNYTNKISRFYGRIINY